MKKKLAKSLYLISLAAVPISIVSCSSNDDSNASSTDFETKVEKLFKEEKLIFKFKTPTITKELFEKYKKDNNKEIKKAFELYKDPSLDEEFDFSILSISDNSKEEIEVEFNVFDVINKNEKAKIKKTISVSFSSAQVYLNNVYKKIVKSKFQLKKQYRKTKLIEIIKNISTPKDFIDNYLEQDVYNDFLGINLELIIPSQSINFKNDFKINMMVEYELDKKLKPQNPSQPTLELDKEQISPITIFNQSDLNENKLESFSTDYIGKLFLWKDQDNNDELIFNMNLSSSNTLLDIDFRPFKRIEFKDGISLFNGNKITDLKFNEQSTIVNLKSGLFIQNNLEKVILPKKVEKFNIGAFDSNVSIIGIESIDLIEKGYDLEKNELHLERLTNEEEIITIFNLISKIQKRELLTINKIFLPNFDFKKTSINIECEEIVFNHEREKTNYIFNSDISNWKVKKGIFISSKVIKVSKSKLPVFTSNSSNQILINRELNEKVKRLIDENKVLNLNQKLDFENKEEVNLFDSIENLDDIFYTFNSKQIDIDKIIIESTSSQTTFNKIINLNNWMFFANNTNQNNILKEVIISSNFTRISQIDNYYKFKKDLESKKILLKREKNNNFSFINNNELVVNKFYEYLDNNNITNNINEFLVGFEYLIKNIDFNNVDRIRSNLLKNLKFDNFTINIETIKYIDNYGLYNVQGISFNINNFTPIVIGEFAFYNTKLNGNVKLVNAIEIGKSAFENSNIIGEINLSSLKGNKINDNVFSENADLRKVIIPKTIEEIGNKTFNSTSITEFDFSNIKKIGYTSFANSKLENEINLSNIETIGFQAFMDTNISKVILSNKITQIENQTFQNTRINSIDLKNVTSIGQYAFSNCNLESINLTNVTSIGQYAFSSNSITKVIGFNFMEFKLDTIFSNYTNIVFDNGINLDEKVNYDTNEKILDLTNKELNIEMMNYLKLWTNKHNKDEIINEVILPNQGSLDPNLINLLKSVKIDMLSWKYNGYKKLNNISLKEMKIKRLNDSFVAGISVLPKNLFENLNLEMDQLNLVNVEKVEDYAFYGNKIKKFINTETVKEIGIKSFDASVEFIIFENVKLKNNSFTKDNGLPPKVKRERIFNNKYSEIYNQDTKVIDFSKINIINYHSNKELQPYLNIGDYLINGDVQKIILPRTYIIYSNLINNLGNVENIEFQKENQQIFKGAFAGTIIANKPNIQNTNIVFDGDNFFK